MKLNLRHFLFTCLLPALLAACNAPTEPPLPGCESNGILILPTATRPRDPALFSPPEQPPGDDAAEYCPTPIPAEADPAEYPTGFVTTEIANLSLHVADQELAGAAVGREWVAVAWITDGQIDVALSRGGNQFQVRRVDAGQSVSLAFSPANRLHMAYEQDGRVYYRAADQGTHPADVAPLLVESVLHPITNARTPQVVVDELNWAHVLYEQDGGIYQAKHLSNDLWLTKFVAYGTNPAVMPFYNDKEVIFYGVPTGKPWFGIIMAAPHGDQVRIFRFLSWFNIWQQVAAFPIAAGEELTGRVGLHYQAPSSEEAWVYAAWVTKQAHSQPPAPFYTLPLYEAANPLFPDQIANPQHIHNGLNAVRLRSLDAPFDAGLKQTVAVPDPAGLISFSAWGLVETAAGGEMSLRLGIDPTGGDNPHHPNVVWSAAAAPGDFSEFAVSAPAQGETATLFLHATYDATGIAVWDTATAQNAGLHNGDFEGPFISQSTLTVPEGWTAYYQDGGNSPISGRDVYTVYAAWSSNGGSVWASPEAVVANRTQSGSTTGAIRPDVFPLISTATESPSVSFIYVYETGDPPPGSQFLRFGRPAITSCALGTADCTDSPGTLLLHAGLVRPSHRLLVAPDRRDPGRALMAWDSLQTDFTSKDVYATYLVLR
jgi:hypothetical protein